MSEVFIFAAEKYIPLLIFISSFYGYGKLWSRALGISWIEDRVFRACLQIAAGMGVFILGMQIIGVAGLLKKDFVRALLVIGIALIFLPSKPAPRLSSPAALPGATRNPWYDASALLILMAIFAVTASTPLTPPVHWDELMYHLPHVREWLSAKRITVNEWLRYPYFPYNFNLLYAAFISIIGDYDASLMHALAGWLTILLLFRFTRNTYGSLAAALASVILFSAIKWAFDTAYIDIGLALFIFSGTLWFVLWVQGACKESSLLVASAFFLGLAAGTKYQADIYLPFFAITAIIHERRPAVWIKAAAAFLAPCIFWYARNWALTGNPVDPLAGNIFGYYDWNAGDFAAQTTSLVYNFPPYAIWLALLALPFPAIWQNRALRWMLLLSIYSIIIWYFTSHNDRYLAPQYPILALLGSVGTIHLLQKSRVFIPEKFAPNVNPLPGMDKLTFMVMTILFAGYILSLTYKSFQRIPVSMQARHDYISNYVYYFPFSQALQARYGDQKIYQIGLEGSLLYGPRKMYGDHFGPWRHRDYMLPFAIDIHKKLISEGFQILAADPHAVEILENTPDFHKYFPEVLETNGAKAYLVLK